MQDAVKHCRYCGRPMPEGEQAPTFPFCSSRCKMADLGRWMSGDYRISEPFPRDEDDSALEAELDQE